MWLRMPPPGVFMASVLFTRFSAFCLRILFTRYKMWRGTPRLFILRLEQRVWIFCGLNVPLSQSDTSCSPISLATLFLSQIVCYRALQTTKSSTSFYKQVLWTLCKEVVPKKVVSKFLKPIRPVYCNVWNISHLCPYGTPRTPCGCM
jgi:hypothetical protein